MVGLWHDRNYDSVVPPEVPEDAIADPAFIVTTQVNYCAAAYPTVPESSPDAIVFSILAGVLRNTFLHPMIREKGGAYGLSLIHI